MDTEVTPDCLHCSYMGAHKYKMCDDCFERWVAEMNAQIEATKRTEMLTAEDYGVVINCVAD